MAGKVQLIVHLDQQFRQLNLPQMPGNPRLQGFQSLFRFLVQLLNWVSRQLPAIFMDTGVGVLRQQSQEARPMGTRGLVEAAGEVGGDVLGLGRQSGPREETLPLGLPAGVWSRRRVS
jgi:hypothetical protein